MIAFVFSGGASLGAVQVGMLHALAEAGIQPDLCVGSSVGALNAAWVAGHPRQAPDELATIWTGIKREDVFPASPVQLGLAMLSRRQHLVSPLPLRSLIERALEQRRIGPGLAVVATDVTTGEEVVLTRGELVPALLASCAIPGVFPPVRIGGRWLVDGGVADNAAISVAIEAGADTVYVLPTGYACALERPPASALGMALHALTLVIQQRLITDAERLTASADVRIVPPLCPLAVSPADFSHAAELIDRGRRQTARWLRGGGAGPGATALRFHPRHRRRSTGARASARMTGPPGAA